MKPERILSDGSAVYKDNVVGPSLADIDFFNNPNRPPLRNFPTRVDLVPAVATSAAVLFIGGCNIGGSEQKPAEAVLGAAEGQTGFETSSKLLNDFIKKWNNKPADFDNAYGTQCVDLVQFWRKAQGGPSFVGDFAYQMFEENPDFYDSVKMTDGITPQAGDILIWGNKYNNVGGHTGIATGKLDDSGKEIVFEENDPWNSPSHTQSYSLDEPTLMGWLRAKNSPTETSALPNSEAILDQYLSIENLDIDNQAKAAALRFWLELFTTKEEPVRLKDTTRTIQIETNLSSWSSEIPNILVENGQTQSPFDITYKINTTYDNNPNIASQEYGEAQINNISMDLFSNPHALSDADIANGYEWYGSIKLFYIFRENTHILSSPYKNDSELKKFYDSTPPLTGDFTDWVNKSEEIYFYRKNGKWEIDPEITFSTYKDKDLKHLEPYALP